MRSLYGLLLLVCLSTMSFAQQAPAGSEAVVPALVNFSGVVRDPNGKPMTEIVGVTFSLYKESQGGAPLWMETQNVQPDKAGHYSVMLGSTTSQGLAADIFATGDARWLGVRVQGQEEQPRVLLLSVPYALKAADAQTLGGLPPSAFVQAPTGPASAKATGVTSVASSSSAPPPATSNVTTTGGSAQHLAMFTKVTNIQNSIVSQTGTTAIDVTGKLGVNTLAPTQSLDVTSGNAIVRGVGNFKGTGNRATLYIGDLNHPIEAMYSGGLSIGAFKAPKAIFIADFTGNVGIGTTTPAFVLDVNGTLHSTGVFSIGGTGGLGGNFTGGASDTGPGGAGAAFTGGGTDIGNGGAGSTFTGGFSDTGLGGAGAAFTGGGSDIGPGGVGATFIGGFSDTGPGGVGGTFTGGGSDGGTGGDGVDASSGPSATEVFAGNFTGDVNVSGAIFAGTKDFRIDHPLDPANKYLVHASVESSEMKNIYDGVVTTDAQGEVTVRLPGWFEALNTDFRYQLTVIGQFAQAIVGHKIERGQFTIRTNAPNVEVSWQVTGVRLDAYAKAHPLVVEQEKEVRLRGFYIHPELYGAPTKRQIEWARHPQMMKKIDEMKTKRARLAAAATAKR
jgi:hypothetical protein